MSEQLKELRQEWECGRPVVAEHAPDEWTLFVIIADGDPKNQNPLVYCCLRYFVVGSEWVVSFDLGSSQPAKVMQWAFNPKAVRPDEECDE